MDIDVDRAWKAYNDMFAGTGVLNANLVTRSSPNSASLDKNQGAPSGSKAPAYASSSRAQLQAMSQSYIDYQKSYRAEVEDYFKRLALWDGQEATGTSSGISTGAQHPAAGTKAPGEKPVEASKTEPPANPRTHMDKKSFQEFIERANLERGIHPPHVVANIAQCFADVIDASRHESTCPCCPTRLVEKGPPEEGNPQQDLPASGPAGFIDDFRPTFDHEDVITHHCSIHECQRCFLCYMGFRDLQHLQNLALSGPILKHMPAVYALLTPAENGEHPTLGDICQTCSFALTYLMSPKTRRMLPNNMADIESHYMVFLSAAGPEAVATLAEIPGFKSCKTRAELLASVVLSVFADLMGAEELTQTQYDEMYPPFAKALEEKNPWGADIFHVEVADIKSIKWPFWGPVPHSCRCDQPDCTAGEHDVEVFHRVLSLLRWTLAEMIDPKRYYDRRKGLGRKFRVQYEQELILLKSRRILNPEQAIKATGIAAKKKAAAKSPKELFEERLAFLQEKKRVYLAEAREMTVEMFRDQIHASKLLTFGRAAKFIYLAVMPGSTSNTYSEPFPERGTVPQKEAWINRFEKYLWDALKVGGLRPDENPDLVPEVRWFAVHRARTEFLYTAVATEADRRAAEEATMRYLSDENMEHMSEEDRRATEVREMRVLVAMEKLKKDGNDYLHLPPNMTKDIYYRWTMDMLEPIFQVFQLAGVPEAETKRMGKPLSFYIFYSWLAVRTERALAVGKEPTPAQLRTWSDEIFLSALNRVELEVYLKGRVGEKARTAMLEGVLLACHPGEDWIDSKGQALDVAKVFDPAEYDAMM